MAHTLITTPFNAESTAMEVVTGVDLTGKRAIVTGGSSGLGVETARALASAGAEVTLAVRNTAAGEKAKADIATTTGSDRVHVAPLDLADQGSVKDFVAAWRGPLHILVNNAGVMATPLTRTAEGWETQFATNHLGHFALAVGLHDALVAAQGARIVAVSSVGHIGGNVDFDDLMFQHREYDEWVAYGQSKTANILFAVEATRRWAGDGILANALNPGRIPSTGLMRHVPQVEASTDSNGVSWKNEEQGAATSVLLGASPLVDGVGGRYFEDCNEAGPHEPGIRRGVAAYAIDPGNAARLWQVSLDLIGA
ncbi:SDR family NAD(P)-dependent oxidoreductase [Actinacidiphila soli]|uniref:SDR family NAD(P)-dependent oxidoreductase n=1 Tax=Actinacidiphila soli TaxID=2487275 RepID=UPI000FCC5BF0|nr:SDR family NAD(P)-dependent oxidoreductase [Actinacidiphila soli]